MKNLLGSKVDQCYKVNQTLQILQALSVLAYEALHDQTSHLGFASREDSDQHVNIAFI